MAIMGIGPRSGVFALTLALAVGCGHGANNKTGGLTVQKLDPPSTVDVEGAKTIKVEYAFKKDILNKDYNKRFDDVVKRKGFEATSTLNTHAHFEINEAKITGTITYVKKTLRYSILEADLVATAHYAASVQVDLDVDAKGAAAEGTEGDWDKTSLGGKPLVLAQNVLPTNIPIAGPLFLHAHFDLTAACAVEAQGQVHVTTGVGVKGDVVLAARYRKAGFDEKDQAPADDDDDDSQGTPAPATDPSPGAATTATSADGGAPVDDATDGGAPPPPPETKTDADAGAAPPAQPDDPDDAKDPKAAKKKFKFEAKAPNFELAPKPFFTVTAKQQRVKGRCSLQPTTVLLLEKSIGAKLLVEPTLELEAQRAKERGPFSLGAEAHVQVSAVPDIRFFGRPIGKKRKGKTLFDIPLFKKGDVLGPAPPPLPKLAANDDDNKKKDDPPKKDDGKKPSRATPSSPPPKPTKPKKK
jgi:hypothetical protein